MAVDSAPLGRWSEQHRVAGETSTARRIPDVGIQPLVLTFDVAGLLAAGAAVDTSIRRDLVVAVLTMAFFAVGGLYRSRLTLSLLDDLPSLAGRVIAASAVATSARALVGLEVTRQLLVATVLAIVFVVILRGVAYGIVSRARAAGYVAHPTLILGAGHVGGQLAQLLIEHPEYGLRPVGFLDRDPLLPHGARPLDVLGGQEELARVIVEHRVNDVIVAFGSLRESEMIGILRTCDRLQVEIFYVPRLFEIQNTSREMDHVWGLPLIRLRRAAFRSPAWRLKRLVDVLAAGTALLLVSPLMAAIALAVRWEGGQGVLFKQERVGLDGRRFHLLKFRSLRPVSEDESQTRWNVSHDRRLGRFGRWLRRTSLDELPQLWNVLRGDMSLVGPRPERPHFVSEFTRSFPRYPARHRVPSGLTGWAQVHGLRGDTSIADRARFDNYYIENWSLWSDAKILLRTIGAVVRREGA